MIIFSLVHMFICLKSILILHWEIKTNKCFLCLVHSHIHRVDPPLHQASSPLTFVDLGRKRKVINNTQFLFMSRESPLGGLITSREYFKIEVCWGYCLSQQDLKQCFLSHYTNTLVKWLECWVNSTMWRPSLHR